VDCWVYCAGQIPLDPASGELVQGDVAVQTRQVLENLTAVLAAADCAPTDVVKTTVFLTDMADFVAMNEVYAEVFGEDPPARSTVQVAALPLGAQVEIEAVALQRPGSTMEETDWTP
jgi:2-iminobutanoate/2-iminopropanoate deaminase